MTSMRNYITPHTVANTIRMHRTRYRHWGSYLVVEGGSDGRMYDNLVDRETCHVEPGHGRDNVVGAVTILAGDGFAGAVGVIDADFMALCGTSMPGGDIFATDTHDLETMMLESPALDKVLRAYGSATKVSALETKTGLTVRKILLNAAIPIGCLRLVSETRNLRLKFDGMDFSAFLDPTTLRTDVKLLIAEVARNSGGRSLIVPTVEAAISAEFAKSHDPWHLCCGHDLVQILHIGLQGVLGGGGFGLRFNPKDLETNLCLAYEQVYFSSTQLYGHLRTWEGSHAPYKVLAS